MNTFVPKRFQSEFVKAALNRYPRNPAITSTKADLNLTELIGRFPKNGNGFKVFKKTWPEKTYWKIMHIKK